MNAPLDELYFKWLYSQVSSARAKNPSKTYWFLMRQLFRKEFVWFVPNDDNRVEDGRDLRYLFLEELEVESPDPMWMDLGCSMLEMMIALSNRLSFEAERSPKDWFWELMGNLRLAEFNDISYTKGDDYEELVDCILDNVIWRTYEADGTGGLFPLKDPREDQRNIEIWYQLSAYLLEAE